ncbi:uncharacterized protein LOC141842833 [Curcuma longa]|uniref:uncharacterized protein LOC141842833 n=1 Tax=Curcuma longa TaxID=136217 RepID=UPI003D9DF5FF
MTWRSTCVMPRGFSIFSPPSPKIPKSKPLPPFPSFGENANPNLVSSSSSFAPSLPPPPSPEAVSSSSFARGRLFLLLLPRSRNPVPKPFPSSPKPFPSFAENARAAPSSSDERLCLFLLRAESPSPLPPPTAERNPRRLFFLLRPPNQSPVAFRRLFSPPTAEPNPCRLPPPPRTRPASSSSSDRPLRGILSTDLADRLKMPKYYTNTPKCRCGLTAKIITSWTVDNPGRRFAICSLFENEGGCGFWTWVDDEMCSRSTQVIPGLLRRITKLEDDAKIAENVMKELEANTKSVEDTMKELKIQNCKLLFDLDKTKKRNRQLFVVMMCLIMWIVTRVAFYSDEYN